MYTVPSVLACFMNVVGVLAIHFMFREHYAGVQTETKARKATVDSEKHLPKFDAWAVALCNIARFAQKLVSANNDTVSTPLAMAMFAFSRSDVLQYVSLAQSVRSFLAFLVYIAYVTLKIEKRFKRLDYRINCMVSLGGIMLFYLITFSWPFVPGGVQIVYAGSSNTSLGCNATKFDWCESLSPVNVYLYYISYIVLVGISFPNLNIALTTLLSRVLGPRRQGTQHGILQMSEGVSRMVGPVVISMLYTSHGPRAAWLLQIVSLSAVIGLWGVSYSRLVPLEQRKDTEKK
ncbi:Protein F27D9.2 [Aphelenchoides avenae]|nr:Protein F27D9.2 [Aphelenchus avenae]